MKFLFLMVLSTMLPFLAYSQERSTTAVSFRSADGTLLQGQLTVPSNRLPPYPAVIIYAFAGITNRYGDVNGQLTYRPVEEELLRRGIAVFLYDKRGIVPVDGSFQKNTLDETLFPQSVPSKLSADGLAAFDHLSAMPDIDPASIVLVGFSEGTSLALKVAEQRPQVKGLVELGVFMQMRELMEYQALVRNERLFDYVDADRNGDITKAEAEEFDAIEGGTIVSRFATRDVNQDQMISLAEWRYGLMKFWRSLEDDIANPAVNLVLGLPRMYWAEGYAEGHLLNRYAKLCQKIILFHGEQDAMTSFADALLLQDRCSTLGTPLAGAKFYRMLGHIFSAHEGKRFPWKATTGPIEASVVEDVGEAVVQFFN